MQLEDKVTPDSDEFSFFFTLKVIISESVVFSQLIFHVTLRI